MLEWTVLNKRAAIAGSLMESKGNILNANDIFFLSNYLFLNHSKAQGNKKHQVI